MQKLAVVGCSQLVTLAGPSRPRSGVEMRELAIIDDGAMLIENGRIVRTGVRSEMEPLIGADCTVIDAGRRVVMPGFVDAHTHPVFAGNRADEFESEPRAPPTPRSPRRAEASAPPFARRVPRAKTS